MGFGSNVQVLHKPRWIVKEGCRAAATAVARKVGLFTNDGASRFKQRRFGDRGCCPALLGRLRAFSLWLKR
jgi:hypothetical protein